MPSLFVLKAFGIVSATLLLAVAWALMQAPDPELTRCEPATGEEPLDLFILAGQSNMVGLGRRDLIPEHALDPAPAAYPVWLNAPPLPPTDWVSLALGYGLQDQDLIDQVFPGVLVGEMFGPEWTFGRSVSEVMGPGRSVGLIKFAQEGTSLADDWRFEDGALYQELLSRVVAAFNAVENPFSPKLQALVWMQGESDAHEGHPGNMHGALARRYEENLVRFISGLRSELAARGCFAGDVLPVVVGRISASPALKFASEVRRAQWLVARDLPRVGLVNTDALSLEDGLHYDTHSVLDLGRMFASAALNTPELPAAFEFDLLRFRVDGEQYCSVSDPDAEDSGRNMPVLPWSLRYSGDCLDAGF